MNSISPYLCSNAQHKVTVTILGRQFTISFYQILEALGQAITDAAFVLTLEHNSTLSTDKTSREVCIIPAVNTSAELDPLISVS